MEVRIRQEDELWEQVYGVWTEESRLFLLCSFFKHQEVFPHLFLSF